MRFCLMVLRSDSVSRVERFARRCIREQASQLLEEPDITIAGTCEARHGFGLTGRDVCQILSETDLALGCCYAALLSGVAQGKADPARPPHATRTVSPGAS